jgi:hypothetical protein
MAENGAGEPFGTVPKVEGKSRVKKILIIFFIQLLFVGGGYFALRWFGFFQGNSSGPMQAVPLVAVETGNPKLNTVDTQAAPDSGSDAPYRSEHFRVGEMAIGGEAALMVPESDSSPLEISSVRGEAFTEKGKTTSKLVITWDTSKPSKSSISFGKGVGQAEGVINEDAYGKSHSVVIPDIAQSSTYVYVITSRDQFGNEVMSDPYAVYTGARDVSLFELIAGAVGEVFGWAVNK